jgi:ABC-type transport system substrate-binding protein
VGFFKLPAYLIMVQRKMLRHKGIFIGWPLLAASFSLAVLPAGLTPRGQESPRYGGTLHVGILENFPQPNLDPAAGAWILATELIFDGLVRLDANLDPTPGLAEYWKPEEEGRRTVFYLRKGVRFHDGPELTSRDVKFSLERLLRPEVHSAFADDLAAKIVGARDFRDGKAPEVAGFSAPDKYIFEVRSLIPNASLLYLLSRSYCKILPQELVSGQGRNFFWKPAGTGPFKFESWLRSPNLDIVGVRLVRNGDYFGKISYVDALELSPLFTIEHFIDGEVEVMPYLSDRMARSGGMVAETGPQSITFLFLNCQASPLNRAALRQALALALDKDRLSSVFQDSNVLRRATSNVIPTRWPGFFPREEAEPSPERARQIIEEQGFSSEKTFPTLTLYLPMPRSDGQTRFARELERELEPLGVSLTVSYYKSIREVRDARGPFLAKVDWPMDHPDPDGIIRPLFQFQSDQNIAHYRSEGARLEKYLDEASLERSMSRRTDLFRRIEEILAEDIPVVPLFINDARFIVQPYVRGFKASPRGFDFVDLREVWIEKREPHS